MLMPVCHYTLMEFSHGTISVVILKDFNKRALGSALEKGLSLFLPFSYSQICRYDKQSTIRMISISLQQHKAHHSNAIQNTLNSKVEAF